MIRVTAPDHVRVVATEYDLQSLDWRVEYMDAAQRGGHTARAFQPRYATLEADLDLVTGEAVVKRGTVQGRVVRKSDGVLGAMRVTLRWEQATHDARLEALRRDMEQALLRECEALMEKINSRPLVG